MKISLQTVLYGQCKIDSVLSISSFDAVTELPVSKIHIARVFIALLFILIFDISFFRHYNRH